MLHHFQLWYPDLVHCVATQQTHSDSPKNAGVASAVFTPRTATRWVGKDWVSYFEFFVGADPCACPRLRRKTSKQANQGEHMGSPLHFTHTSKYKSLPNKIIILNVDIMRSGERDDAIFHIYKPGFAGHAG